MGYAQTLVSNLHLPPRVQQRLAQRKAYRPALRANRTLSTETWGALWHGNLPVDEANPMVSRPLTETQVDAVLATERRVRTLGYLLYVNELTETQLRLLIDRLVAKGKPVPETLVSLLTAQPNLTGELHDRLGSHTTGPARLTWLTERVDGMDPKVVAAELYEMQQWWGRAERKHAAQRGVGLRLILDEYPAVTAQLVTLAAHNGFDHLYPTVRLVLAGCRHVRDEATQFALHGLSEMPPERWTPPSRWAAMASAGNPVTSTKLRTALAVCSDREVASLATRRSKEDPVTVDYDQVADPETLERLVWRSTGQYAASSHRPWDLLALARNPHLEGDLAARVRSALANYTVVNIVGPNRAEAALARFGPLTESEQQLVDAVRRDRLYAIREKRFAGAGRIVAAVDATPPMWSRPLAESERRRIEQVRTMRTLDCDFDALSAILFETFGDDPHRWELFIDLAEHHTGRLTEALGTVTRLAAI